MKLERAQQIHAAYEMFEEAEPDISTERLLAQVCQFCHCEVDGVLTALDIIKENQP